MTEGGTEFLPSYYGVLYYGKSFSGKLLKNEEYTKGDFIQSNAR